MRMLQHMLAAVPFDSLPAAWTTFSLGSYTDSITLWDYQQEALRHALIALWKYYDDLVDYRPAEPPDTDVERKRLFWSWYEDNDLAEGLDISLKRASSDIVRLLEYHYKIDGETLPYRELVNRISFWMATASGKTLVLVKLLELLWRLAQLGEIPPHDILVLTHRDDLLDQLAAQVHDFNTARGDLHIRLRDLREYPEAKRERASLFERSQLTVFTYRSDNLSDEQKEKIVDFRNYDNDGRWYVLLDEAHKGDKEDSKRQHIYSILSRNGFLFNFSATFTDPRDIATTAFNFNLAEFISAGYGKNIAILQEEASAFRDNEDYTGEEKQRIVLEALMLLALARHAAETLPEVASQPVAYHRPLLLTLANSVNVEDADLKLFFRQLARIAQDDLAPALWEQAKDKLRKEIANGLGLMFQSGHCFTPKLSLLDALSPSTLRALVYNTASPGAIEVVQRPGASQELAFKLKPADQPFALIKIGHVSQWQAMELAGYETTMSLGDEAFFEALNQDGSPINILMGSRAFYEGWDSNRPNVALFINIGTSSEARKFILQSVGRGVRIEPIPGQRQRLLALRNAGIVPSETYRTLLPYADALETLLILGTSPDALRTVIEELERQTTDLGQEISLDVNIAALDSQALLIPRYRASSEPLIRHRDPAKYSVRPEELEILGRYVEHLGDDRLFLAHHKVAPARVAMLRSALDEPARYFTAHGARRHGDVGQLLLRVAEHLALVPQEVDHLQPLEDEIRHFRHLRVSLEDVGPLQEAIERVRQSVDATRQKQVLRERYDLQQISLDELLAGIEQVALQQPTEELRLSSTRLELRHVANHYYNPILLALQEKAEHIKHTIRTPSEVRFIHDLETHLSNSAETGNPRDWWLFSKLDESLDDVYIPYYDPDANRIRRFFPDFVFWQQTASGYAIVFIDPKGMQQSHYQHKIDSFRELFGPPSSPAVFEHESLPVTVHLRMYGDDANLAPQSYRQWWVDHPAGVFIP